MSSKRRPTNIFSLAFLDCICCGFGAVILLFVLTVDARDRSTRESADHVDRRLTAQRSELAELKDRLAEMLRAASASDALEVELAKQAARKVHLDGLELEIARRDTGMKRLLVDVDKLQKEIAARQTKPEVTLPIDPTPVGVPVGSNYIAFVIDTSGSMRDPNSGAMWPGVLAKIDEVLEVYPEVKGIQLLDADGRYIFGRNSRDWISDSPEARAGISQALRRYDVFSNSNPVPGIFRAFQDLLRTDDPDMRMGIYIFGDEFTGTSDTVVRRLDQLNPADEKNHRRVSISAVGFPTAIQFSQDLDSTGLKYANLMREIAYMHGGAFIAVTDM